MFDAAQDADAAGLIIESALPATARSARIVRLDDFWKRHFRAFGLLRDRPHGTWVSGRLLGQDGRGRLQVEGDLGHERQIGRGFSGTPLWDEQSGGVAGMIVSGFDDGRSRTSYAVTAEMLLAAWPDLERYARPLNPYRGLDAFGESDSALFHGRAQETADVLDRLRGQRVVPVTGDSGVGKSSLIHAGVVPHLRARGAAVAFLRLPGREGPSATHSDARSGRDPAARIWARALLPLLEPGIKPVLVAQRTSTLVAGLTEPAALTELIDDAMRLQRARELVFVIDQAESLLNIGIEQRGALLEGLGRLIAQPSVPAVRALLTVRLDQLSRLELEAAPRGCWGHPYVLSGMREEQLREIIAKPLGQDGVVRFEDGLVDRMLRDTGRGPHALPTLEFTLARLWDQEQQGTLSHHVYENIGGVEGALAQYADEIWNERLDDTERAAAKQVILRLIRVGTGDVALRRPTPLDDLGPEQADVARRLATTRIFTITAEPDGDSSVDLAHEALANRWDRLREWIENDRFFLAWRDKLRDEIDHWQVRGQQARHLLGREDLISARTWLRTRSQDVSASEIGFIERSADHRRRMRRRMGVIVVAILALIAIAVSYGLDQNSAAARNAAVALSRRLAVDSASVASSNPVLARQLAVAAWSVSPTPEAGSAMTSLLAAQQRQGMTIASAASIGSVAFSPDGSVLAAGAEDGTLRLLNPATGQPLRPPIAASAIDSASTGENSGAGVYSVAFSRDGKLLATGAGDGTVRLFNPATGQPVRAPITASTGGIDSNTVYSVAFSRDGKMLATGASDGTVRLFNPATGQPVRAPIIIGTGNDTTPVRDSVYSVAFSPDGTVLAVGDRDGMLRLFDSATGRPLHAPIAASTGDSIGTGVFSITFSPDGQILATGGRDGDLRLFSPDTGQLLRAPIPASTAGVEGNAVDSVAFSPDGKTVATGGLDGTLRLWDPATGHAVVAPDEASSGSVTALDGKAADTVAFSPDGKIVATGGGDGTVRRWNSATGQALGAPSIASTADSVGIAVDSVAFSPDGKMLATGGSDGTLRLWDPATGQALRPPIPTGPDGDAVYSVAFSPDGRMLATSALPGTVRLYNPNSGKSLGPPITVGDLGDRVYALAFSPDGKMLAVGEENGHVELFDPISGRALEEPLPASAHSLVESVAFSPDGMILASGATDGTLQLWDPATGQPRHAPITASARAADGSVAINAVAFSHDSKMLVSAASDGAVRLYNPATGQALRAPIAIGPPDTSADSVAFSPDGTILAVGASDGIVRLYNPTTGHMLGGPITVITVSADSNSQNIGSVAFSPDGTTLATGAHDGMAQVWDVQVFRDPYAALCAQVGELTSTTWNKYAPNEPHPAICGKH